MLKYFKLLSLLLFVTPVYADGLIVTPSQVGVAPIGQIPGTTTNNDACAGCIGEYVYSLINSPVALTTGTYTNMTSISLTAGDWDVSLGVGFQSDASTSITQIIASITQTSCAGNTNGTSAYSYAQRDTQAITPGNTQQQTLTPSTVRVLAGSTVLVYACVRASFTAGTLGARGYLSARRVR